MRKIMMKINKKKIQGYWINKMILKKITSEQIIEHPYILIRKKNPKKEINNMNF